MTGLSQSHFLQALGWATLNSFWQMALLWCCFLVANQLFNLTANKKYIFSITSIAAGFLCFVGTFVLYYQKGTAYQFPFFTYSNHGSFNSLPLFLTTASVTYLLLLTIPAYRLLQNWQFAQSIRRQGLQKADVQYKLFVKKISSLLGIRRTVVVYVSSFVKSPLTVGYLKPIILLPFASVNNLTLQQMEAVLLHELSHIRRYDYLVNLLIYIAYTFLYFNPFVNLFIKIAEEERENCCDQTVLKFGYDKLSYASALLNLEKLARPNTILAMGAVGKKNLLNRIEKIVGMEKKPVFRFTHFAGLLAAFLSIFAVNSMVITANEGKSGSLSFTSLANPFYFLSDEKTFVPGSELVSASGKSAASQNKNKATQSADEPPTTVATFDQIAPENPSFIYAASDDIKTGLSLEAKKTVEKTVETTRKVLRTVQWKEVEKAIGEVMTEEEKELAKADYLNQIENINWQNLEKNLQAEYEKIDWTKINIEMKAALATAQLDSIQQSYEAILNQMDKILASNTCPKVNPEPLPFPDESMSELKKKKTEIRRLIKEVRVIKERRVIKL